MTLQYVQKPWCDGSKFGFSHPKDQGDKIRSDKSLVLLRPTKQNKNIRCSSNGVGVISILAGKNPISRKTQIKINL